MPILDAIVAPVAKLIDNGDGTYEPSFVDDYNNKDKARAYWVSLNARF